MDRIFAATRYLMMTAVILVALAVLGTITAHASDKTVETVALGEPKYVYWESDTVGRWSSVSKAHEYQVKLFTSDNIDRDEDNWRSVDWDNSELEAVMTKRTSELSCDFTDYMKDGHTYFFVVRATARVSEQAYVKNGAWVGSPDVDFTGRQVQGITGGKWRNYLEGTRYEDADGNLLAGGWQLVQGAWYLFDENGYRQNGWVTAEGSRYYLYDNGKMATGWFAYEGNWYYAGKDGATQTGWVMEKPGVYYYLQEDGTMAHDVTVDGYEIGSDGISSYSPNAAAS